MSKKTFNKFIVFLVAPILIFGLITLWKNREIKISQTETIKDTIIKEVSCSIQEPEYGYCYDWLSGEWRMQYCPKTKHGKQLASVNIVEVNQVWKKKGNVSFIKDKIDVRKGNCILSD